jgi:hypothetical protein
MQLIITIAQKNIQDGFFIKITLQNEKISI